MTSLSGPEISGPHNHVGEMLLSGSGPETPARSPPSEQSRILGQLADLL